MKILASWSASELNATDTDSDASTLSWSVTESPTNGTVTIDGTGSSPSTFTYQPNSNYFGSDTFTVQVSDGLANDSIAVNLTINPVDDPAIIIGDLNKTIQEDITANGTIIASDIDGLTDGSYYLISASPGNGSASIDQTDGNWSYVPHPHFFGNDFFIVSITDDLNNSTTQVIGIFVQPVNDPSIITGDFNRNIQEDGFAVGDINATDPDGMSDGSNYTVSTPPQNGFAAIDPIDGNWSYVPHPHFFGNDSFTISITDDLNNSTNKAIGIFVQPVNDPSIITGDFNRNIQEDGFAAGDINATDPDGMSDGSNYTVSTPPQNGFAAIDLIDGNWSYVPHPHFFGNDSFTISITDDLNNSTAQVIDIFVQPVDDPSVIKGDLNATIYADILTHGHILATDSDGFSDKIIFEIYETPQYGNAEIDPRSGQWTYLPSQKQFADDSFEISVTDQYGNKTIRTINLFAQINHPLVKTLRPIVGENHSIALWGEILSSKGYKILGTGFYMDSSSDFAKALKVETHEDSNASVSQFGIKIDSPVGITYIKAFATTKDGEFFGQTIRFNPFAYQKFWLEHTTPLEADWLSSDWFGDFIPYTENWIFHVRMGWLYIAEFSPENLWVWSEEKKWIWTTKEVFPFFFSNQSANWLYLLPDRLQGKSFYNYETKGLE